MISPEEALQKRFGIRGQARIESGMGRLPRACITHEHAEATIYLHGAHVTQYTPSGQNNALFLSTQSQFAAGKAIRGGVPICFPWFGPRRNHPDAPMHGFARLMSWELDSISAVSDGILTVLTLKSDSGTKMQWPGEFELRYSVLVGKTLRLELQVSNVGPKAFTFEEALHTYLRVTDVRQAVVEGLGETSYLDKTDPFKAKTQPAGPLTLTGETDRIYLNTQSTCTVRDPLARRRLVVRKEHSNNTVLWNPWIDKAKAMGDFGDDEWPQMVCVETCNVGEYAIELQPGASHTMVASVQAVQGN